MKIKTSELKDAALDWAVAWAENITIKHFSGVFYLLDGDEWNPTRNWAQGGPFIDRANICLWSEGYDWEAKIQIGSGQWLAEWDEYPLIAAMRCYVASKLGDEIEVPEELAA